MKAAPLLRQASVLEDEYGLHVVPLSVLLLEVIGPQYVTWTSEALHEELSERFGPIGPLTWERVMSLRVLQGHDAFWKEWEVFEKISSAINGQIPLFNLSQPQEPDEIAIAIETASKFDKHEYSQEVRDYIAACCLTDGLWSLTPPLEAVAQASIHEFDRIHRVERDYKLVREAMGSSPPKSIPDHVQDQIRRNDEIREVLAAYRAAVNDQLSRIPSIIAGSKS